MLTVFTRSTCAPCKTVKYYLTKKGVPYIEKNIDEPEAAKEFALVSDFQMVPLVVSGDNKVQGLNLSALSKLLQIQQ